MNEQLATLQALGIELPSPAYIFGAVLFGLLGLAAWRYGRKTGQASTKWLGVVLMVYPYAVSNTWMLYGVGLALCVAIWLTRD